MDDYSAEAWQDILADFTLAECEDALRQVVTYQAFVAPADIVRVAKRARSEREAVTAGPFGKGCGQPGCRCTHTWPCDRGMTDSIDMPGAVSWCGTCWPDRQPAADEDRQDWIRRLQGVKRG